MATSMVTTNKPETHNPPPALGQPLLDHARMAFPFLPVTNPLAGRSFAGAPAILAAVVLMVATSACATKSAEALAPRPLPVVTVQTVARSPAQPIIRHGTVRSGSHLRLGFDSSGVLASITVHDGESVKKGQLLAKLGAGEASASLRSATTSRQQAADNVRITDHLADTGSIANVQLSRAKSDLTIARANEASAAEVLSHTRLRSPISGVVVQRLSEPGEPVNRGAPVLVIEDVSKFIVTLNVVERDLSRVSQGQRVQIITSGQPPIEGSVMSVSPAPNDKDGLYAIEITPGPIPAGEVLHSGMPVDVQFAETKPPSELRVPLDAIVQRHDKAYVAVVVATSAGATIALREVTIAHAVAQDVVLSSGLDDTEKIVSEGAQYLSTGEAVRVLDEKRP